VDIALAVTDSCTGLDQQCALGKIDDKTDKLSGRQLAFNRTSQTAFTNIQGLTGQRFGAGRPLNPRHEGNFNLVTLKPAS
jgi:hypothetical protein